VRSSADRTRADRGMARSTGATTVPCAGPRRIGVLEAAINPLAGLIKRAFSLPPIYASVFLNPTAAVAATGAGGRVAPERRVSGRGPEIDPLDMPRAAPR
jgi:hypothetical protein